MIKKVRIAVDHGNRNMKTCSQVFTTGLTIQDKKPARGEKFLFYEGKYYVLSENRIPYQRDKTQDDRFFILTLFAIVKELEENSQIQPEDVIQVDIPIGLPPKHYAELVCFDPFAGRRERLSRASSSPRQGALPEYLRNMWLWPMVRPSCHL